ncbi:MAG: septation protein SpoVG family protein [Candidatus Yanofskybacteria bacterium]|nr:septation protein SpoVG family protein [Candidatus Yanofskybacteria bacterium]
MNHESSISEIQISPVKPKDGLIAFASFVLDGKYYVGSVAIFTRLGKSGYRLVYPAKKLGEKNLNFFHPISQEAGKSIEDAITEKVNELFNDRDNETI